MATYYSFLSPGLAPPKIKDTAINGHRNGVTRALLPVAQQGQPSERTRVHWCYKDGAVVKQWELSLGPRGFT